MSKERENSFSFVALGVTLLLHLLIVLLLWRLYIERPEIQEESGVPVMLGSMGNLDTDYDFTEVQTSQAPVVPVPVSETVAPPLVTQDIEETVSLETGQEEKTRQKVEQPVHQPTAEELQKQAEDKAAAEANQLMAGLFNQTAVQPSSSQNADASAQQGVAGSTEGNSTTGKTTGTGSYGTWDLGGRDMLGDLPRPDYNNIQDEGRVVVNIEVNPEGEVISVSKNNRTNTINQELISAAFAAARKAKFNRTGSLNNQSGTITYYFKLR